MPIFTRLFRLVWGGDVDRALRPVLAVSLVGAIAGASVYTFLGIWAVKHLGAAQGTLAFAYLGGAVLAGVTGYVGGHWSDKIGRRPLILLGWGFQAIVPLALIAVGSGSVLAAHVGAGLWSVHAPKAVYRSLRSVPRVAAWKIRLWLRVMRAPHTVAWSRTARKSGW